MYTEVPAGACWADGRVVEVAYLGALSRARVEIGVGAVLTVVVQNAEAGHRDVAQMQGRPVRLSWKREHTRALQVSPVRAESAA
jgi:putative spermidine/putrescine transport system ATP-binding protein